MNSGETISIRVFELEAVTDLAWKFFISKNHKNGALSWSEWFSKKYCTLEGDAKEAVLTMPVWLYKKMYLDRQNEFRTLEIVTK